MPLPRSSGAPVNTQHTSRLSRLLRKLLRELERSEVMFVRCLITSRSIACLRSLWGRAIVRSASHADRTTVTRGATTYLCARVWHSSMILLHWDLRRAQCLRCYCDSLRQLHQRQERTSPESVDICGASDTKDSSHLEVYPSRTWGVRGWDGCALVVYLECPESCLTQ